MNQNSILYRYSIEYYMCDRYYRYMILYIVYTPDLKPPNDGTQQSGGE
eukprot:SAG31_NODE_1720_length_7455_cov_3.242115_7_plen_48_part_00